MKRKLKVKVCTVVTQRMTKQKTRLRKDNIWMWITHHTTTKQEKRNLIFWFYEKKKRFVVPSSNTVGTQLQFIEVHVICPGF